MCLSCVRVGQVSSVLFTSVFCWLQVSPGDTGWDVFSLDYHVDGPIATVRDSAVLVCVQIPNIVSAF